MVEVEGMCVFFDVKVQGFEKLFCVVSDMQGVMQFFIVENIVCIVEIQVGVIKGFLFEKVIVMGGGVGGQNVGLGQFVQDFYKGVLLIQEFVKSVGLNFLVFFGMQVLESGGVVVVKMDLIIGKISVGVLELKSVS